MQLEYMRCAISLVYYDRREIHIVSINNMYGVGVHANLAESARKAVREGKLEQYVRTVRSLRDI